MSLSDININIIKRVFIRVLYIYIIIILPILISGCETLNPASVKPFQPSENKMFRPEERLFSFTGSKISIEAPTVTKADGTTEPVYITRTYTDPKTLAIVTEKEPVMVDFWVKDTSVTPPKTFFDVLLGLGKSLVIFALGEKALAVVGATAELAGKSPVVVTPEVVSPTVITPTDSGSFEVKR